MRFGIPSDVSDEYNAVICQTCGSIFLCLSNWTLTDPLISPGVFKYHMLKLRQEWQGIKCSICSIDVLRCLIPFLQISFVPLRLCWRCCAPFKAMEPFKEDSETGFSGRVVETCKISQGDVSGSSGSKGLI